MLVDDLTMLEVEVDPSILHLNMSEFCSSLLLVHTHHTAGNDIYLPTINTNSSLTHQKHIVLSILGIKGMWHCYIWNNSVNGSSDRIRIPLFSNLAASFVFFVPSCWFFKLTLICIISLFLYISVI